MTVFLQACHMDYKWLDIQADKLLWLCAIYGHGPGYITQNKSYIYVHVPNTDILESFPLIKVAYCIDILAFIML